MTVERTTLIGTPVLRVEDRALLTVGGSYIGDLELPGAVHVTFVRATQAHAELLAVDVTRARAAPGVVAVFTGTDLADLAPAPPLMPLMNQAMRRPFLATGTVRFVGEAVAAI
ncbi:MAG TPA: xanthine dehydrogenase family protein molybdopterin-binding subunit, partial [Acidimicrobiales bacterium]|nr:xanthine dehydrogenase family protein molybdopterin-binding subunit [Acidimicrobiales bacterium]